MSIVIKTRKEVDGFGNKVRCVLGFKALKKSELPEAYLKIEPRVFVYNSLFTDHKDVLSVIDDHKKSVEISVGKKIKEEQFQEILRSIHAAGENLMRVNKELKAKREKWNGEETFLI